MNTEVKSYEIFTRDTYKKYDQVCGTYIFTEWCNILANMYLKHSGDKLRQTSLDKPENGKSFGYSCTELGRNSVWRDGNLFALVRQWPNSGAFCCLLVREHNSATFLLSFLPHFQQWVPSRPAIALWSEWWHSSGPFARYRAISLARARDQDDEIIGYFLVMSDLTMSVSPHLLPSVAVSPCIRNNFCM